MTEVEGADGESIVFDGTTVAKFTHHGDDEIARNPVSDYRESSVKVQRSLFGKVKQPVTYDVLLAMASFMSLTVDEAGKRAFEALVSEIEAARDAGA